MLVLNSVRATRGRSWLLHSTSLVLLTSATTLAAQDLIRTEPVGGQTAGDVQTFASEILDLVIVEKAKQADRSMNAITQYLNSLHDLHTGGAGSSTATEAPERLIQYLLDGGTEATTGDMQAAIFEGPTSGVQLSVSGGGTITTDGLRSFGFAMLGDGNATEVFLGDGSLNSGLISTIKDQSTGIDFGRDQTSASLIIDGGSVSTTGDRSAAVVGFGGADSVFYFSGIGGETGLILSTTGQDSPGVDLRGDNSASVINLDGTVLSTQGDRSPLLSLRAGSASSVSVTAESSTLQTSGESAHVLDIDQDGGSDTRVYLDRVTITSEGDNSWLVRINTAVDSSVSNLVMIDAFLRSEGGGSVGVYSQSAANSSSMSTFIGGSSIRTGGNDAPTITLFDKVPLAGSSSVQNLTLDDVALFTTGDRSPGLQGLHLGDRSAEAYTVSELLITTMGSDSPGWILYEDSSLDSVSALLFTDVEVSTEGDRSAALSFGGSMGINSLQTFDLSAASLATLGSDSPGFELLSLPIDRSSGRYVLDDLQVSTTGDGSAGLSFGRILPAGPIDASDLVMVLTELRITTVGDDSPGVLIRGPQDGATSSDISLVYVDTRISASGDRSPGFWADIFPVNAVNTDIFYNSAGITIDTTGEYSPGLVVGNFDMIDGGMVGGSREFLFVDADVQTSGDHSPGLVINPLAAGASSDATISLQATDTGAITTGDYSPAVILGPGLGSSIPGEILNNLALVAFRGRTTGAYSHGLIISEGTTLTTDPDRIGETSADGTVINGRIGPPSNSEFDNGFDLFSATGQGSRAVMNYGTLDGGEDGIMITPGLGIQGNFGNAGLITATGPVALTYEVDANSDDIFELYGTGDVVGNVLAGNGFDSLILGGPTDGVFDAGLFGKQYQGFDILIKDGASTWTLSGPGPAELTDANVAAGRLVFDEDFSGLGITVDPLGQLFATGQIGSVLSNGVIAPGGIGTIAPLGVNGDLTLAADSILAIDIDATGASGLLEVSGSVTLDGRLDVNVIGAATDFGMAQSYAIITSTGPDIAGAFATITHNLPDVDVVAVYGTDTVELSFAAATVPNTGDPFPVVRTPDSSMPDIAPAISPILPDLPDNLILLDLAAQLDGEIPRGDGMWILPLLPLLLED
jgi:hypothetical protein